MIDDQSRVFEEIRGNVAFEQFIVSVITGAASGGILFFITHVGAGVMNNVSLGALFLSAILQTFLFSFLVFLIGFFASVIIINPLYKALEKVKRRNVWPYAAAVMGIVLLALIVLSQLSRIAFPDTILIITALISGLVVVVDFGRRMRPVWRATIHAEQVQNTPFKQLH